VERVALGGVEIAEHPGQQPGDGVDDAQGGGLAPAEDEIAEGQLLVDEMFGNSFVDTLVAPGH
jgi:hypothetical protein